jgi:hypothetical protein
MTGYPVTVNSVNSITQNSAAPITGTVIALPRQAGYSYAIMIPSIVHDQLEVAYVSIVNDVA